MTAKRARNVEEPRRRSGTKASRKAPVPAKKRKGASLDRSATLELRLRKTVAELGLTEARKIFASVEAAFGELPVADND